MANYFYNKYNVVSSSYYTMGSWRAVAGTIYSSNAMWTGYSFNSSTGEFSNTGSQIFIRSEDAIGKTVYYVQSGNRSEIERYQTTGRYNTPFTTSKATSVLRYEYSRGSLITTNIIAENGTYPNNGRHSDGFWYVRQGLANTAPTIALDTTNNRTLYENDVLNIRGNAKDADSGDVVTVRYSINGGADRAITTATSSGANIPFNKSLTFKQNKLLDGGTAITGDLAEGSQHTLKVWAEDDQGGKSTEQTRIFYVVPFPQLSLKINGVKKTAIGGAVKVNGQIRHIQKIYTKINGILKEV